ncbi:MAG: AzlD domain-containing protein [Clostridium sp.]
MLTCSLLFKNVGFLTGNHGILKLISIFLVIVLHLWKRQMLLSIAVYVYCTIYL